MEYKRTDGGLKINREALARFTEFSNLRLCVYTPYAHENSNQCLILALLTTIVQKLHMHCNFYNVPELFNCIS